MLKVLAVVTVYLLTMNTATAYDFSVRLAYGKDDRIDVYNNLNPIYRKVAKATAGMINSNLLNKNPDGSYKFKSLKTLGRQMRLGPTERFYNQPTAPICSGFLIDKDILVTAGHCYLSTSVAFHSTPEEVCDNYSWIFDYKMDDKSNINTTKIKRNNVYKCERIIKAVSGEIDFAIIKLKRKVVGRRPLKYRKSGKIESSTPLAIVGHPSGLPMKIAENGTILVNSSEYSFVTNLDAFHGNSGSPVINTLTGFVEGILANGNPDYAKDPDDPYRKVVNRCDDLGDNCLQQGSLLGEGVTRITEILEYL